MVDEKLVSKQITLALLEILIQFFSRTLDLLSERIVVGEHPEAADPICQRLGFFTVLVAVGIRPPVHDCSTGFPPAEESSINELAQSLPSRLLGTVKPVCNITRSDHRPLNVVERFEDAFVGEGPDVASPFGGSGSYQ